MKTQTYKKVRMVIQFLALALTLQALSYSTRAAVNMRDASFLGQWKDFDLSTERAAGINGAPRKIASDGSIAPRERFELVRYYNSRSYHVGLFGYGWCTDFEKKITFGAKNKITLHDCKLSAAVEYTLPTGTTSHKRVQLTLNNEELEFNEKGQLISVKAKGAADLILNYDSQGRIKSIQASNLRRLEFETNAQLGLIKKVISKEGGKVLHEATYEYDNENLIAVKSGKTFAKKHMYDRMNNLTRIDENLSDGTKRFEVVVYDEAYDRVKKYQDPKGCLENFSYMSENTQNTSFVSVVERRCKGEVVARATYRIDNRANSQSKQPVMNAPLVERSVATSTATSEGLD